MPISLPNRPFKYMRALSKTAFKALDATEQKRYMSDVWAIHEGALQATLDMPRNLILILRSGLTRCLGVSHGLRTPTSTSKDTSISTMKLEIKF